MKRKTVLMAATFVLAACGSAKNGSYPGVPLATLQGSLTSVNSSISQPVHLAIAWYPYFSSLIPGGPPSIVTQDVSYQGTFPIQYTFNLYEPPPASAVGTLPQAGPGFQLAIGVILAYLDNNQNGTLDPIGTNGSVVDTILGSSVPDVTNWYGGGAYLIVWASGPIPSQWVSGPLATASGLVEGYQILNNGSPVPLSTDIPIAATQAADLNLFVCSQLFVSPQVLAAAGTPCAVPPSNAALQVQGLIISTAGAYLDDFGVTDGIHVLPNASVAINGTSISYDPQYAVFDDGSNPSPASSGTNTFEVSAPGLGSFSGSIVAPPPVVLTSPTQNESFSAGSPIAVSWSPSSQFMEYEVDVNASDATQPALWESHTRQSSTQVNLGQFTGAATVGLSAIGSAFESGLSVVVPVSTASVDITVGP
jgi:hypothetical protein